MLEIEKWIDLLHSWIWGYPLLALILGVAVYLTFLLKGLQFRYLVFALKQAFSFKKTKGKGDISHFQSLMTAIAGTVGIGNIAGVATAVAIGGVGAIFWIWVMALLGMSTRYAESLLAVKYRVKESKTGMMCGGPMYFIRRGLGWKFLAALFAFGGAAAAIVGGNMIQSNSIADAFYDQFGLNPWYTGLVLALITGIMLFGGIRRIALVASYLVPVMSILYLGGGLWIIISLWKGLPEAFYTIFYSAFNGQAAVGGFTGSTTILALQLGMARGISASEAGLGSGAIAAAAAKTDSAGRMAMVSMTGTFISAFVVSTITGLVLVLTNVISQVNSQGIAMNGAPMTIHAFESVITGGTYIVVVGMILFGFTTVIGWAYYGEKCVEYLFGVRSILYYRIIFIFALCLGAALELAIVWKLADIANAMMVIPNVIGLLALSKVIFRENQAYLYSLSEEKKRLSLV